LIDLLQIVARNGVLMATSKGTHTGARLGTRLRGKLAEAYSVRGHQKASLYYVYSPRTDHDCVLKGNLHWGHFLLAESDPRISTINYAPAPQLVRVAEEDLEIELSAIATFKDGVVEWREVKDADATKNPKLKAQAEAALQNGVRYVRLTEREIYACPQRIANWSRVIAWLSAVRGRSIFQEHLEVVALLNARGCVSLGEVYQLGSGPECACYVAAALKAVQDGFFISDLDEKPLNKHTLIKCLESGTSANNWMP
jgi:hypothetical protein